MTEDQQPVWVESDGVSNLPPKDAVGMYRVRSKQWGNGCVWFAFFAGNRFYAAGGSEESASSFHCDDQFCDDDWNGTTRGRAENGCDAWWDYQGLMAKSQTKTYKLTSAANGCIYSDPAMTAKVNALHACGTNSLNGNQWHGVKQDESIMTSDEPGIVAMAERSKPAPEPEKIAVGGLTIDMADLVEFLKTKQPKPEPNATPRGILTMWNESADHRLGAFQQTGNFAD